MAERNKILRPASVTEEHGIENSASPARKYVLFIDVAVFLVFFVIAALRFKPTVQWIVGMVLAIACFVLWMIARQQLGPAFKPRPAADQLVTNGLYAKIRHPIYFFGLLSYLGVFLAIGTWWFYVGWVLSIPFYILRARSEEKVLSARFGDAYDQYKKSTWF